MPAAIYVSIPGRVYATAAGVVMLATMFYTYHACENEKLCPPLPKLPTISNTWDNPPGNFVSRYVVSHVALAMALAQFVIWKPLLATRKCAKVFQGLAVFSVFCFSCVGAICDSDSDPQCRGNNTLHVTCAVIFLVLYNMNMCCVSCKKKKKKKIKKRMPCCCSIDTVLLLLAALSFFAKLRFVPQIAELFGDETPVAIFEWLDVIAIILWTSSVMWFKRLGYSVQLRTDDPSNVSGDDAILLKVPARTLVFVVLAMFFTTLAACTGAAYKQGRVPKGSWPYISDTFVYPPGNWISRYMLILGGTFSSVLHVGLYFLDGKSSLRDKGLCLLAVVAIFGLAIVGACNETENIVLHYTGAGIFFIGYDAFMVLYSMSHWHCTSSKTILQMLLAVVSTALTVLRFTEAGRNAATSLTKTADPHQLLLPLLEWANAVAIVLYMSAALLAHGKDATTSLGVAVVKVDEVDATEDANEGIGLPYRNLKPNQTQYQLL